MRWRAEFARSKTARKEHERSMRYSVEVVARNREEAIAAAKAEASRTGKLGPYHITNVRKI